MEDTGLMSSDQDSIVPQLLDDHNTAIEDDDSITSKYFSRVSSTIFLPVPVFTEIENVSSSPSRRVSVGSQLDDLDTQDDFLRTEPEMAREDPAFRG